MRQNGDLPCRPSERVRIQQDGRLFSDAKRTSNVLGAFSDGGDVKVGQAVSAGYVGKLSQRRIVRHGSGTHKKMEKWKKNGEGAARGQCTDLMLFRIPDMDAP